MAALKRTQKITLWRRLLFVALAIVVGAGSWGASSRAVADAHASWRLHWPAGHRLRRRRCANEEERLGRGRGFDDRPRASAHHECHPPHRGLGRITRIRASSRLTTALDAPAAGWPPRFTTWWTGRADRWSCWSRPARPTMRRSSNPWWPTCAERRFNSVKQWRGLATRYDKLAITYRAAAVLRAITIWTAHLSDTP